MMDEKQKDKAENKNNPFTQVFSTSLDDSSDIEQFIRQKYKSRTLVEKLGSRFQVSYNKGCNIMNDDVREFKEAVALANNSDLVIMTLGGNCGWANCTGGEGKDRCNLDLPGVQQQLIDAVAQTGKDIVLILYGPGQYAPHSADNVKAVINAWLTGAYGGAAIAKILCGEVNPSGKLPVTMPRNVGQVPIFYNHKVGSRYKQVIEKSGINMTPIFAGGYVDGEDTPLFPFGFGLSYTSFEISDVVFESKKVATDGIITCSCAIRNIGEIAGDEVV